MFKKVSLFLLLGFPFFAFNQTTIIDSGAGNFDMPMDCNYRYSYEEHIYLQSQVSSSGNITEVYFYYDGYESFTEPIKLFIGHTSKKDFSGSTDWVTSSGMTEVYSGNYSVTTTAGWHGITLDTPFSYNNTDNLVIGFYEYGYDYHSSSADFYSTSVGAANHRSIYFNSDSSDPDPSSPPSADGTWYYVPNLQLSIVAPLPINLVYFKGEILGNVVDLTWETKSEKNNSHFIVESTLDGDSWSNIGSVAGKGNSIYPQNYSLKVRQKEDLKYYRLIQVDFDGNKSIYNTISIKKNEEQEGELLRVIDVTGREVDGEVSNGLVFEIYENRVKKVVVGN
jgi:hypothetical protein